MHWSHDNLDELAPGELLRLLAELSHDTEVAAAWVEQRRVTEWRRSGGAELLHVRKGVPMTVAPYLTDELYVQYLGLAETGRLDVLASDVTGEDRHVVTVDGGEPRTVTLAELEALIRELVDEPPAG